VRRNDEVTAQRRRWTFYETINLHDSGNPREPWKKYFPLPLAGGGGGEGGPLGFSLTIILFPKGRGGLGELFPTQLKEKANPHLPDISFFDGTCRHWKII
jgi:hypothetical protein